MDMEVLVDPYCYSLFLLEFRHRTLPLFLHKIIDTWLEHLNKTLQNFTKGSRITTEKLTKVHWESKQLSFKLCFIL